MQRVQRDDAPHAPGAEPIDRAIHRDEVEMVEHGVERAVLPEHLADADRADKRRQDEWHEQQAGEKFLSGKIKAIRHERERQRDGQRRERAAHREEERVAQTFEIDAIAEDLGDEVEGEMPIRIEERARDRRADRPDKEAAEEGEREEIDEPRKGFRHRRGGWRRRGAVSMRDRLCASGFSKRFN